MKNLLIVFLSSSLLICYPSNAINQPERLKFIKHKNVFLSGKMALHKLTRIDVSNGVAQIISSEEFKEYYIKLSVAKEGNSKVRIKITTDFPDGVNFLVSASRDHYLVGSNETYAGEIFSKDFTVKNGKIEKTVTIDDSEWYNEHQRLVRVLPNDIMPISKISDKIEISVLYTPASNDSAHVQKILGSKGENVSGKGAEKFGPLTIFRISKELNMPFKK